MVQADADMAGQHAREGRLSIYTHRRKPEDMNPLRLRTIAHFFEHYKDLEEGKWVKILGWEGPDAARKEIMDGVAAYQSALGRAGLAQTD